MGSLVLVKEPEQFLSNQTPNLSRASQCIPFVLLLPELLSSEINSLLYRRSTKLLFLITFLTHLSGAVGPSEDVVRFYRQYSVYLHFLRSVV